MYNTSCNKEEDYNAKTYYDAIGIGYVFIQDTSDIFKPVQGAEITVSAFLEGGGDLFSPPTPKETFLTDASGMYKVRFIKRTQRENALKYYFEVDYTLPLLPEGKFWFVEGSNKAVLVSEIKGSNDLLKLDTIYYKYD